MYSAATTTFSTGLTYSAGNVTCNTANGSTFGCLAAADWSAFNSKIGVIGNYGTTTGSSLSFSTTTTTANGLTYGLTIVPAANGLTFTPTISGTYTGQAGSVANALTLSNGGSGASSGSTYNGASAVTISYNSIGAVPTTRNVNTTYPLQGGGSLSTDLTLTSAFSTTTNTGLAQGFTYIGSAGAFLTAASSSFFGYTPLNPTRQLTVAGTGQQITSSAGAQDLSADRTWTLSLANHVKFPGDFEVGNSTTTNATTTGSVYLTGITASRPLYVDSNGKVGSAGSGTSGNCVQWGATNTFTDAGSPCGTGSGGSGYPFALTGNATSTLTQFNGGLTTYASSTIGNGTATSGLTINGTATTTNLIFTGITNSLLSTNGAGLVTASTTIGWNLLKGQASSIFAFDANGNPTATTTIGVNYLTGILPTATGGTNHGNWTTGSIPYASSATGLTEDNSNLFWDGTNHRLGIGTTTPQWPISTFSSSGPQLSLSAGAGIGQWTFRNAGGDLFFATTTTSGTATSTGAAPFFISGNGEVGASAVQPATSTAMTLDWNSPNQIDYLIGTSATTITLINATTSKYWGTRKLVWVCNPGASAGALTWVGVRVGRNRPNADDHS